jgi:8-oxo-dGTP diphosphatase
MKTPEYKYPHPSVTTDVLLFTVLADELNILLIKRNLEPYKGSWALPGGFVHISESLEDAAMRELKEEGNVDNVYLEQLFTFGDPIRDPRSRVITVTYLALADSSSWDLKSSGDAKEAKLFPIKSLPKLAFDHRKIVDYGLERLRSKIGYSNIVLGLLPDNFTLSDLQKKHEVILGTKLDKRNFRKKILSTGLLLPTGNKSDGKAHRPAAFYKFKNRKLVITD